MPFDGTHNAISIIDAKTITFYKNELARNNIWIVRKMESKKRCV